MSKIEKEYTNEFKYKVVMESFQRDTTSKQVQQKYNVPQISISRWRSLFTNNAPSVFSMTKSTKTKVKPEENIEDLKKLIGQLTIENDILKKALNTIN